MRLQLFSVALFLVALITSIHALGCQNNWEIKIQCTTGDTCLRSGDICDGTRHCKDGSDELYCNGNVKQDSPDHYFRCSDGANIEKDSFCDHKSDCKDKSDEIFCNLEEEDHHCPVSWFRCHNKMRCIPSEWKCDYYHDCSDASDEFRCEYTTTTTSTRTIYFNLVIAPSSTAQPPTAATPSTVNARNQGTRWLLNRRKNGSSTERWGHNVHRIASAIFMADEDQFLPGRKFGEEIGYELTIQLLHQLSGNHTIRNQELALYIQALTITCSDPRDFFGQNLVSELRRRVESSNYTNPFEILTLCNAKDNMTNKDIERVTKSFDSPHRPFWTDNQAISAMALQCLSSSPNVKVDERMVKDMQEELKKRQFRNGTVDNPITTALVLQALFFNESYKEFFDLSGAISVLLNNQDRTGSWGSIQNSYYVLPALNFKSLLNISSKHCVKEQESEQEALNKLQSAKGEKFIVQYSIWVGNDVDLGRTWRVRLESTKNHTFYDVIETVRRLDSRHNVTYNVMDYKPYVSSLYGKQDDPELDMYWFTYVRSLLTPGTPKRIDKSPVDVKVEPNQELILWYKPGKWDETPQDERTS